MGPKKDGRIAKYSANHQLKTSARLPKSTDCELLNTDIDTRKKSTLRSCTTNPQENNTVDSKGICTEFPEENATCGSNRRHVSVHREITSIQSDILIFADRTDPEAVELTYSDMKCLEPEGYLKSPVINFCLQYLKKSRHRGDLYMFNTYFYSKLEEALSTPGDRDSQFSKLRRWWRNVDIFKKAYIILPINEKMHWSLIIVCMPTKEGDSGPVMLHLDSLGLHSSQKLFDTVARYLEAEWRHLQKDSSYDIPFSGMIWKRLSRNIKGEKVEMPHQCNEYDCGLIMLHYIDKFIQEAPERFTKGSLGMFGRKWFNHEEASQLREGVRARLFDLFQSAEEDDGPSEPEWHPGDHSEGEDKDADTVMAITLESE
ncbi:ubiquitin-like-specific protease 1D [Panicum miliaceum]|uniref:Ubiquitin-like-specific protease 1D n=1 Tax=Panicum miliaceum TaxID=4540 RepID=A0A3L6SQG6_PANMI|nr:ubiquitin-like-specific protease 1D [Panicum miliaceum]